MTPRFYRIFGHALSVVIALVWFGVSLLISSCTASSPTSDSPPHGSQTPSGLASTTSSPGRVPTPTLAPSLPTGTTTCGSYGIAATTQAGTQPLLSCAALAYGSPVIRVRVGDQILLSGLVDQSFVTSSPAAVLDVHGSLLTARQPGAATIIVHNWFCVPENGTQATSCPLAQVTVT